MQRTPLGATTEKSHPQRNSGSILTVQKSQLHQKGVSFVARRALQQREEEEEPQQHEEEELRLLWCRDMASCV